MAMDPNFDQTPTPYPTSDPREGPYNLSMLVVGALPGIGPMAQVLAQSWIKNPLTERQEQWISNLGDQVIALQSAVQNIVDRAEQINISRGVQNQAPPPSIALPALENAILETRPELRAIWEKLLAAAMDPARQDTVRKKFVEIVKALDPLDALVMDVLWVHQRSDASERSRHSISQRCEATEDEVEISLLHIVELGLAISGSGRDRAPLTVDNAALTVTGRELMRCLQG